MATPTKSQNISTPKPQLSPPNKLMASPRPGTSGNSNRPLAYKSPAVKTPASVHGHHISVSSQPSSTPLAATAVHDDLLALNSPAAALINSLGTTGLTPLGSGADGLGITAALPGGPVRPAPPPVHPEVERLHRTEAVVDLLKSRVGGHGITRGGVERIAQLQGFTTLWDDDNLTIAGNCVDLEINFDAGGRDDVRDVSLKLNISDSTSESEEPQFQEQGTQVIKSNLQNLRGVSQSPRWSSLDAFAANLQYLSQLDRIESGTPCFNAVGDLYSAFQKIWDAEKERSKGWASRQHLRQGAVGRPVMDRKPRLGVALDYWDYPDEPGQESETIVNDMNDDAASVYTARISCEPGLPSTAITKQWVSDPVLVEDTEAMLDVESEKWKPDWRDPAQDSASSDPLAKAEADDSVADKPTDMVAGVLDMHFSCTLEPGVYLPLNVAANLNVEVTMLDIKQELTSTYQAALQKHFNGAGIDGIRSASQERWLRVLPVADDRASDPLRRHSYALQSSQHAPPLWCYPVKHLKFNHPKQLAAVLPVLRQYAVVWGILRSLVEYESTRQQASPIKAVQFNGRQSSEATHRPWKRTNKKSPSSDLDDLAKSNSELDPDQPLPVDLNMDILSDVSKARLDVYIPCRGSLRGKKVPFIFLSLNICQGGGIEVRDLRGIHTDGTDGESIRSKIVRILEVTEDIGLTVEWLLEQAAVRR
ncbi:uncharacterized protein Z520_01566 [Fonsecaea multimorphosa CBS 102226]|uniref:Mediator of RNA polymerase II transcription subunit 1 n=1 Tax=Fonsecaea multimorphosa CBS 102226 TaxID=1442371 RepID=A0A0D2L201_9EURO|nr:uncharacterized protein Z520_01566 [Fonsecaea multimorphosa CBS 102226]KIY03099.1 hypothetical protein Z520_01566 [Fonsecaea multimorphosa CBS 102226]OAL30347.1 hypothetical protein AYO22_01545 [Fonsecaea multimorphosa]